MKIFNNVTELKESRLSAGQIVKTKGYYTPNDGGGAEYLIVASGTGTDDGGSYINLADNQAQLITTKTVKAEQFGAKGDGVTNDTLPIQSMIDYIGEGGTAIFDGQKSYGIIDWLIKNDNVKLFGNGAHLISLGGSTSFALINGLKTASSDGLLRPFAWQKLKNCLVDGFTIDYSEAIGLNESHPFNMIQFNDGVNCRITNCTLKNNYVGVSDFTRGSATVFRGECESCVLENCDIDTINFHGEGNTNKYLVGDFTIAAGEFGTEKYTANTQINGRLRSKNITLLNNRVSNTKKGMAFDAHTYRGVANITDNIITDCHEFFKNQYGPSNATGNYVIRSGNTTSYLCWLGYSTGFLDDPFYPDEQSVLSNNTFRDCNGTVLLAHSVKMTDNSFVSDTLELTVPRINLNQFDSEINVSGNRFQEKLGPDISFYIQIVATNPTIQGASSISNNEFQLFTQRATGVQMRIINAHSISPFSVSNNRYTEKNSAADSFIVFAIGDSCPLLKVSDNTIQKAASQALAIAWNASNSASCTVTGNTGVGGTINGTFAINANNLIT